MRHKVNKNKFKLGKDANRMLIRKLIKNLIKNGVLTTTKAKGKVIKSVIDKLVNRAKINNQANRNTLLRLIGDKDTVKLVFDQIGPVFKTKTSGFLKTTFISQRTSDGAEMVKLQWSEPILFKDKENKAKEKSLK